MTARTVNYWQTVNWFGYFGYPMSERPWQNKQLWDWTACCSDQITQNGFFGILGAVFGYNVSRLNSLQAPTSFVQPETSFRGSHLC